MDLSSGLEAIPWHWRSLFTQIIINTFWNFSCNKKTLMMLWLTWFWRHVFSLCSHQLLWQIPHADQLDSHLWSNSQELPCNSSGLCRTWVNYHAVLHTVCPMICVQNKDIVTLGIIKTFPDQRPHVIENTPNQTFQ